MVFDQKKRAPLKKQQHPRQKSFTKEQRLSLEQEKRMHKFKIGKMLWLACVLAALFAGCGREQGPSPPFSIVIATSPANGATGVLTNTIVSAGFSSVMNPASINATSFTLTGPGATPVAGAVSYSGTTATFTPAGSL